MKWVEIDVSVTTEGIEAVAGILLLNGVNGYTVTDSNDFKEFLNDSNTFWDYIEDDLMKLCDCDTKVTFYLPDNNQGREMLVSIKSSLERLKNSPDGKSMGSFELSYNDVDEEEWANNWKKYFKPFNVGNRLIIKPSWENVDFTDGRIILEIDPASAFGSGSHATTSLCLEAIEKIIDSGAKCDELLDMGCGSGILGIGGYLCGAKNITGVDIDEISVKTAIENAEKNHIPKERYTAYYGSIISDKELFSVLCEKKYDIIAANIVSDVLIAMAESFYKLITDDGYLIVSGIIYERTDEVLEALEKCGFYTDNKYFKDDWACAVVRKK